MNTISRFFSVNKFHEARQSLSESAIHRKVRSIALKIFKFLKNIIIFPLRYFGSKTWSLPGLLLRLPGVIFRRVFRGNKTPIREELFKSGYSYKSAQEMSPDQLRKHFPSICTIVYAFNCNKDYISPFGYKIHSPKELIKEMKDVPKWIKATDDYFVDKSTGLKVVVLEKDGEMVVSYGAIGSYTPKIDKFNPSICTMRKQLYAKATWNIMGFRPTIYHRANKFFKCLSQHQEMKGKPILITGGCFGGSMASYVALKNKQQALCVNTLQLGGGLQQKIGDEKLKEAHRYVTHISVKGDWLTRPKSVGFIDGVCGFLGLRSPGNFGNRFVIPTPYKNRNDIHRYYLGSVMHHLGYDKRAKPNEVDL